jgi:hypothetical protein
MCVPKRAVCGPVRMPLPRRGRGTVALVWCGRSALVALVQPCSRVTRPGAGPERELSGRPGCGCRRRLDDRGHGGPGHRRTDPVDSPAPRTGAHHRGVPRPCEPGRAYDGREAVDVPAVPWCGCSTPWPRRRAAGCVRAPERVPESWRVGTSVRSVGHQVSPAPDRLRLMGCSTADTAGRLLWHGPHAPGKRFLHVRIGLAPSD